MPRPLAEPGLIAKTCSTGAGRKQAAGMTASEILSHLLIALLLAVPVFGALLWAGNRRRLARSGSAGAARAYESPLLAFGEAIRAARSAKPAAEHVMAPARWTLADVLMGRTYEGDPRWVAEQEAKHQRSAQAS